LQQISEQLKMKEEISASSATPNPPVPPPHFDDERTVLAARPVVPLEQINTKIRHRRQWVLGGAFAIAMMLGAASALVASYLRLRSVDTTSSEVSQVEVTSEPLAVAESVPAESPVVEETEQPLPMPVETPKKEAPFKRRIVERHSEDLPGPRPKMSEEEDLNRIREAVLYDEWQERRERRATRRERRRLDRYNHRDLSNLDEIFEGRRRRINPD
jgi:hypothetical protein